MTHSEREPSEDADDGGGGDDAGEAEGTSTDVDEEDVEESETEDESPVFRPGEAPEAEASIYGQDDGDEGEAVDDADIRGNNVVEQNEDEDEAGVGGEKPGDDVTIESETSSTDGDDGVSADHEGGAEGDGPGEPGDDPDVDESEIEVEEESSDADVDSNGDQTESGDDVSSGLSDRSDELRDERSTEDDTEALSRERRLSEREEEIARRERELIELREENVAKKQEVEQSETALDRREARLDELEAELTRREEEIDRRAVDLDGWRRDLLETEEALVNSTYSRRPRRAAAWLLGLTGAVGLAAGTSSAGAYLTEAVVPVVGAVDFGLAAAGVGVAALALVSLAGGYAASRGKSWYVALAGSLAALVLVPPAGLVALLLVVVSEARFGEPTLEARVGAVESDDDDREADDS
ncbi:MAG: hypothetical protein ACOCT0_05945 [Halobacteriota archaeon]